MMNIVGIVDNHSASVAMVKDGELLAAHQEERPTRLKNKGGFPAAALKDLVVSTGIELADVDLFTFSTNYYLYPGLESRNDVFSMYDLAFDRDVPGRSDKASRKGSDERGIKEQQADRASKLISLGVPKDKIIFVEHHTCHAAAAYYGMANFDDDILVFTCDGQGDQSSATAWLGSKGKMEQFLSVDKGHSLGQIYTYITYLLGLVPLEHEYKLMGLAPYAEESKGANEVKKIIQKYFVFDNEGDPKWRRSATDILGHSAAPQLARDLEFRRFDEIAGGVQLFIEETVVHWIERLINLTGAKKVALSGGVFMNVKLNKLIMEMPQIEELFIFPSCGDESNSIGAAWYTSQQHRFVKEEFTGIGPLYLGSTPSDDDIELAIEKFAFTSKVQIKRVDNIEQQCAQILAEGGIVGRFSGRGEFGARALGNRSILADPRKWATVHRINRAIKMRDFWMPFAPAIRQEDAEKLFVNKDKFHAPYMVMAFDTTAEGQLHMPAAVHPNDQTCRPQVVQREFNPNFHELLTAFADLTGYGAVLNTSFNLHGEPLVETPTDALDVFNRSGLDVLAIGSWLISKDK
ncbi:MAG: carbamoyltransferase [Sulfitobacter sp.]|nr:MAG: carbamoyltransferase [Sulfitobacter sp.]